MKIKPYPGKVALIQSQDGVEKEVTMNYESSWQECLQLWGPQKGGPVNGHVNGLVSGNCNYTHTLDVIPQVEELNDIDSSSVAFESTNGCSTECDTLHTGHNGTVASHSFNYINNFAHDQCQPVGNDTVADPNGHCNRSYGRQRCCPQMLAENQMAEPAPFTNGDGAVHVVPKPIAATCCPSAESYDAVVGWMAPPPTPAPPVPPPPLPMAVENGSTATPINLSGGYVAENDYPYKNHHRKLYRTPTMLEKSVGLPYLRENVPDFAAPFNIELSSNRVPVADHNGFLIPRPKLIVPVHTYGSRKRRTGNILHSKRRGSDSEPTSSSSTAVESKKHHTSCPGKAYYTVV